jgi:hypothetical protein
MNPVTEKEVAKIIKEMKLTSSTGGYDNFTILHLKLVVDIVSKPLSLLITQCFDEGVFPEILKVAKVIPLYKGGQHNNLNNYRPISLLSAISKIFEKTMKFRVMNFLEFHNVLNPVQYGFRSDASTTMAVLDFVHTIERAKDDSKDSMAIFLDLQKAFDLVDHCILLQKLENYGCRGTVLQLFKSYLLNRKQFTFLNGHSSSLRNIKTGVPQGSVLGPLLFLIFINDFSKCCDYVSFRHFADDTVVIVSHPDQFHLSQLANKAMIDIHTWLANNKLSLNVKKTTCLYFKAKNSISESFQLPEVMLQGQNLSFSKTTKYLGFIIDDRLSFYSHISQVIMKLRKFVGIFWKTRLLLPTQVKYIIYNGLFCPHLNYGIELYGNAGKKYLNTLQRVQNKAVKALFNIDQRFSTNQLYACTNILNIEASYKLRSGLLLWKLNQHNKFNINSMLLENNILNHIYNTRSNLVNFNLQFQRRSFTSTNTFKMMLLWNEIPTDIKKSNTYGRFQAKIKKFLQSI